MENKMYDVIIIGAGPAGMTAAIYAGRSGKSICIIDRNGFGGNIINSPKVENIPGFTSVSGAEFAASMYSQMLSCSPDIYHIISEVKLINQDHGLYKVFTEDNEMICGLTVILATGSIPRTLKLDTQNIYYCVTCDGPMFKKKNVFVVGSGNTGATYALELSTYCKHVYISDITSEMCCETELKNRIMSTNNITWLPGCTINEVKNSTKNELTSVNLSNGQQVKCSAIFSAIGMIPQTENFTNVVSLNKDNYIITDNCATEGLPGLFAAGDCRVSTLKQVTTACADGSIAATLAVKYINNLSK